MQVSRTDISGQYIYFVVLIISSNIALRVRATSAAVGRSLGFSCQQWEIRLCNDYKCWFEQKVRESQQFTHRWRPVRKIRSLFFINHSYRDITLREVCKWCRDFAYLPKNNGKAERRKVSCFHRIQSTILPVYVGTNGVLDTNHYFPKITEW